jgi:hypothetical protein
MSIKEVQAKIGKTRQRVEDTAAGFLYERRYSLEQRENHLEAVLLFSRQFCDFVIENAAGISGGLSVDRRQEVALRQLINARREDTFLLKEVGAKKCHPLRDTLLFAEMGNIVDLGLSPKEKFLETIAQSLGLSLISPRINDITLLTGWNVSKNFPFAVHFSGHGETYRYLMGSLLFVFLPGKPISVESFNDPGGRIRGMVGAGYKLDIFPNGERIVLSKKERFESEKIIHTLEFRCLGEFSFREKGFCCYGTNFGKHDQIARQQVPEVSLFFRRLAPSYTRLL